MKLYPLSGVFDQDRKLNLRYRFQRTFIAIVCCMEKPLLLSRSGFLFKRFIQNLFGITRTISLLYLFN